MSHYRKIDVRIWNDEKFTALPVEGKLAFMMLLTHPMMTALGAMRGTPTGLIDELCCGDESRREAFREGLAKAFQQGMVEYDAKASLLALPNFIKYNGPESPNVVKAWPKAAEFLPECDLKNLTIQRAVGFAEGLSKGFREAIPEGFRKAYPKAYPNQRTESREQRTEIPKGKEVERYTSTREDIPSFASMDQARSWLLDKGAFPADVDELASAVIDRTITFEQLRGHLG